jgi:LysM repeat protein
VTSEPKEVKLRIMTLEVKFSICRFVPLCVVFMAGCITPTTQQGATHAPMPPKGYASEQQTIYSPGYLGEIEAEYDTLKTVGFACNEWNDVNLDGLGDFPDEFVGIKNQFETGEKLTLIFLLSESGTSGKKWTVNIFTPDGKQIESRSDVLKSDDLMLQTTWEPAEKLTTWLLSTGGPGTYRATWYLAESFAGTCAFDIAGEPGSQLTSSIREYTIRKGDSLSRIAARLGMNMSELAEMNDISNPNVIRVGQIIRVIASAQTYTVKKGDSLSQIAQIFETTTGKIRHLNNLKGNRIFIGQELLVPKN